MKIRIILSAIIILILAGCKKGNDSINNALLQDGPLSDQLGKRVYLGKNRYVGSTPVWGRNSDELFINASSEILRVDMAASKIEVINNSGGVAAGKTNENSGVLFMANINNQPGYYLYKFHTNSIEKIKEVPTNQGSLLHISGNNAFYYLAAATIPNPPCNGYCWPIPGPFVPATFYHIDLQTQQTTDLRNKQFMLFSPDGSSTILSSQLERRMYLFDNNSRNITDSSDLTSNAFFFGLFFHNGLLHSFEIDVHRNIIIKNFYSGQVTRQYQSNLLFDGLKVSGDGTKLYYIGGVFNENSQKLGIYDIIANTEKIIAELPYLPGGGRPFDNAVLSDDNTKVVIQAGNDLYLKILP